LPAVDMVCGTDLIRTRTCIATSVHSGGRVLTTVRRRGKTV
jgi:hypothetical protein